jgi:hypothetical protein
MKKKNRVKKNGGYGIPEKEKGTGRDFLKS